MEGIFKIDIKNLVLKIDGNFNQSKLPLDEWQDFLDVLCGDRDYQKEAIKAALIFLFSEKYDSVNDLVVENYNHNDDIQALYNSPTQYIKNLQLPNMLSAVIDLATGTGKSYVLFGIAFIALALGKVKRILALSPSLTIETGLNKKFEELLRREDLRATIPDKFATCSFHLVNATGTIMTNDICIENIHAVYQTTGSSIKDSFTNSGYDTLVLSDEVHHVYNKSKDNDIKKWKEFILDENYGFKFHIGVTGTAYIDDEYFNDVIYRYSLRQAIDDKIVKNINYVDEDVSDNDFEKFQKIYQNHSKNKIKYSILKPLSIIVTSDIASAKILYEDFVDFLSSYTKRDRDVVKKEVLIVTSHKDHKNNIPQLQYVDNKDNSIEWVISVSMLTEGWDVKNVFQIVPWEDRAFNSKLLISQVLGRGLRIPLDLNFQPSVRIFNHASWRKNIRKIVDEVLENEAILYSNVLKDGERSKYNFTVHNLIYDKIETQKFNDDYDKIETFDISKPLTLVTQEEFISRTTSYIDTKYKTETLSYDITKKTKTVEEVTSSIINQYKSRKNEARIRNMTNDLIFNNGETEMDKLPTYQEIVDFIKKSMKEANISGNKLTMTNVEKINGKFTALLRKKRTSTGFETRVKAPIEIQTNSIGKASIRYSSLRNDVTVFFSNQYSQEMTLEEKEIFEQFKDEFPPKQFKQINIYELKTPLNMVFANRGPETKFIGLLTKKDVVANIDSWVKSRDVGFYKISYILKRGSNPKEFNPDFFIKSGNRIIVIEIKADGDISKENYSKMIDAQKHFSLLNAELAKSNINIKYYFNILSPSSYPDFEKKLLDNSFYDGFKSEIEVQLSENFKNKND